MVKKIVASAVLLILFGSTVAIFAWLSVQWMSNRNVAMEQRSVPAADWSAPLARGASCLENLNDVPPTDFQNTLHKSHQPKMCHKQLAQSLLGLTDSADTLRHAAYHQILSGQSFRRIPLTPGVKTKWKTAFERYGWHVGHEAVNEVRITSESVYESPFELEYTIVGRERLFDEYAYRPRRKGETSNKKITFFMPAGILLILLVLLEGLFFHLKVFPKFRFFYKGYSR